MMVTGIVIFGLSVLSMGVAVLLLSNTSVGFDSTEGFPRDVVPVALTMFGGGALGTIVGVSLWVAGGEEVLVPPRRAAPPRSRAGLAIRAAW